MPIRRGGGVLLRIAGIAIATWCAITLVAWVFQRSMIYFPLGGAPPPSAFPPRGEHVAFETEDGLRLSGWLLPPQGPPTGVTVLVFNGNAGDRSLRVPLAELLSRAGHGALLFDYRGFGGNPGRPTEEGLAKDARAAREFVLARPGTDPTRLVYYGESLGAAVAVRLAAEHPPLALVLRSPFTSLADLGQRIYFLLPVRLLLRDRYPSAKRIGGLNCPILIVAGERDTIVPFENSRELFDAAREPKRFVTVPGADHNDDALLDGEVMTREVLRFVEEAGRGGLDQEPSRPAPVVSSEFDPRERE